MNRPLKILIHTQYYPPEIGAPQARLSELAKGLSRLGFLVSVLTAMPNYPRGKVFKGYKGLRIREEIDKVPIVRTWIFPTQKVNFIPRLFNYLSFVFSSLFIGIWGLGKLDFVLTESPPLFLGISGYLLSRLKRAKWIFNVSDLWPESVVRLGILKPGLSLSLSRKLEAFCYRKAWLVTGQSREILRDVNERFPGVKTYHLSNGVDVNLFSPEKYDADVRQVLSPKGELVVLYGGLHGVAQGLGQVLDLASSLKEVRFVLIGDGPEKQRLITRAKQMGLTNVVFLELVNKEKIPAYVASADICVVPLCGVLPGAVPSKIYEAMASAKPILLIADGEAREIVEKNNVGLVASPGDKKAIYNALQSLIAEPGLRKRLGSNGRLVAETIFSRDTIVKDFYQALINHML